MMTKVRYISRTICIFGSTNRINGDLPCLEMGNVTKGWIWSVHLEPIELVEKDVFKGCKGQSTGTFPIFGPW